MSHQTRPDMQDTAVLVSGGAGFIGSHLVDALLEQGAHVRVLDNLSSGNPANLAGSTGRIEFIEGDIRDEATCRRACEGVRVVFHQAALGSVPRSMVDPATSIAVNVMGTSNMFAAARDAGVDRVVYASSSSVYGDSARLPKREGEEGSPLSPYALSKAMNEGLADMFGRCFGMKMIGLRYFNVYGPRQDPDGPYAAVIPRFFKACLTDAAPVIFGDGTQSRDFTFVTDAVAANLRAAAAPATSCGRAYNVAGGVQISVNDLARQVRATAGRGPEARYEASRPGDVLHSVADLELSRRGLGYLPRVDFVEGLRQSLAHYEKTAPSRPSDNPRLVSPNIGGSRP